MVAECTWQAIDSSNSVKFLRLSKLVMHWIPFKCLIKSLLATKWSVWLCPLGDCPPEMCGCRYIGVCVHLRPQKYHWRPQQSNDRRWMVGIQFYQQQCILFSHGLKHLSVKGVGYVTSYSWFHNRNWKSTFIKRTHYALLTTLEGRVSVRPAASAMSQSCVRGRAKSSWTRLRTHPHICCPTLRCNTVCSWLEKSGNFTSPRCSLSMCYRYFAPI